MAIGSFIHATRLDRSDVTSWEMVCGLSLRIGPMLHEPEIGPCHTSRRLARVTRRAQAELLERSRVVTVWASIGIEEGVEQ